MLLDLKRHSIYGTEDTLLATRPRYFVRTSSHERRCSYAPKEHDTRRSRVLAGRIGAGSSEFSSLSSFRLSGRKTSARKIRAESHRYLIKRMGLAHAKWTNKPQFITHLPPSDTWNVATTLKLVIDLQQWRLRSLMI